MDVQYEELTNKINIMILKNKKENKDVNIKNKIKYYKEQILNFEFFK